MPKNKKMANIGLLIALVGAIMVAVGGYLYNKFSGKARVDNHNEVIGNQKDIKGKIDSSNSKN